MDQFLYPKHLIMFVIIGQSEYKNSCSPTNLSLKVINGFEKLYLSPHHL